MESGQRPPVHEPASGWYWNPEGSGQRYWDGTKWTEQYRAAPGGQELENPSPRIAGYRLERVLGRGGMGVVYVAVQERLNRRVALKVIVPELAADPVFRRRFENEAEHAASIDHPNVVPIYEANEADGNLYLAMRFVDGQDLGIVLAQTSGLPVRSAAAIVSQVASALDAAHARGLVHRDVKPANILIEGGRPDGHVYLTDFGLTKTAETHTALTHTGRFVGTLDYAAPEQIESGATDARTDVYSLSCVLWHALTGEPPYEGGEAQKMWAHMHHPPPSLEAVKPRLARDFGEIVSRGMAKRPAERYQSAGDLGRAAVAAANGERVDVPERSVATGVAAAGIPGTETMSAAATEPGPPSRDVPRPKARREATLVEPAGPVRRSRSRVAGLVVATLALLGLAAGGIVMASSQSGDSSSEPTTQSDSASTEKPKASSGVSQNEPPAEPQKASEPIGGGGTTAPVDSSDTTYVSYKPTDSDYGYRAEIPQGGGWLAPAESYPTGGALLRTSIRGPGGQFLLIDRTPYEVPQLGGGFDSSGTIEHPSYGPVTKYVISDSNQIPECNATQCVDYLINDGGGGGWGVLAGGPDLAVAEQTAQQVALSLSG